MCKACLIIGMGVIGCINIFIMKKIAPEDKLYPVWALFIVVLFALIVVYA